MTDKPKATASEVSDQAAIDAQKELIQQRNYSGGSAMLDAEIEAGKQIDDPVEPPSATNRAQENMSSDPTRSLNVETTGIYPPDLSRLEDEGSLAVAKDSPTSDE